ncbi:MAG TPA: YIP1 family protein [Terracidiphilus sp.]|nr:YIP1 family protein [Terracidiphilus sp.]
MSDTGIQPAAESTAGLSQVQRVTNMFSAPSKTFTDIRNGHSSWWLPFVIYVILGYCFFAVVNTKVGIRQASENQIHLSGQKTQDRLAQLTPEQREANMKITTTITTWVFYLSPVFVLIWGVVAAAVLLGTINFGFGGKAKFGSVFSMWMYAMLPYSVIKPILGIAVLLAGAAPESFNMKNYAPTNVGAFLSPTDTGAALYAFCTSLDAVTIWTLVLMGIGLATVAGVKRGSGYFSVFGWWVLIVLLGVGSAIVMG